MDDVELECGIRCGVGARCIIMGHWNIGGLHDLWSHPWISIWTKSTMQVRYFFVGYLYLTPTILNRFCLRLYLARRTWDVLLDASGTKASLVGAAKLEQYAVVCRFTSHHTDFKILGWFRRTSNPGEFSFSDTFILSSSLLCLWYLQFKIYRISPFRLRLRNVRASRVLLHRPHCPRQDSKALVVGSLRVLQLTSDILSLSMKCLRI